MGFSTVITYDDTSQFTFDATLIEISGGLIRLKDLGGATYSTANPTVTTQHQVPISALTSLSETKSVAGSDQVKYQLIINGTAYWRDTVNSVWEESDGTYDQSNTAAEITAAVSSLFSDLSLTPSVWVRLKVFLHSDAGSSRPSLTNNTLAYENDEIAAGTFTECLITCYLKDLLGDTPTYDAEHPAKIYVRNDRAFFHGTRLIQPFSKSAEFNSSGYAELSVIETETIGEYLTFFVTLWEGRGWKTVYCVNAVSPNAATRALSQVTTTRDNDPG